MKMQIVSLAVTAMFALNSSVVLADGNHREDVNLFEHQYYATSNYLNVHGQHRELITNINNQSSKQVQYRILQTNHHGYTRVISNGSISPNENKSFHKNVQEGNYSLQLICQNRQGCNATGYIGFFGE